MTIASTIHVALLPAVELIVLWLLTAQVFTLLLALVPGIPLIAWCLNPLGITALYLRQPPSFYRFIQFIVPLGGAALVDATLLHLRMSPLISGLVDNLPLRIGVLTGITVILGSPRIVGALRELRYPLWGELRLLDRTARPGTIVYFTPAGRGYLRERFGTTPEEFVRIVRRRSSSLVTGTPL